MNAAQTNLYFFEWGRVREHYLGRGLDPKQADAKRHELHVRALGGRKSSKDFTNADLDKVIATFRAITQPCDFNAQMRQQNQPDRRKSVEVTRIGELKHHIGANAGYEAGYVASIVRSNFGTDQLGSLTFEQLKRVAGILERRVRQLQPPERAEAIFAEARAHAEKMADIVHAPRAVAATAVRDEEDGEPF